MNAKKISAPAKAISVALPAAAGLLVSGKSTSGTEGGQITARYVKVNGLRNGHKLWIPSGPESCFP